MIQAMRDGLALYVPETLANVPLAALRF